ncbi:hypothetical protein BU26DRAFT_117292 [Trematosphaeria pertusa]|uniref:GST C-terminal domain-containing protein n=1 Tax=Trematosphaeria pertusa TaxID=390896 RepID=A0A6A6HZS5_9PLEO|nr:uncharacterized protein BU26DRAFT_117292 [Trematosphaeria pertusa]KAF2243409.1 hypothetical protein BU26DRAFT_117292 [Trematosphaeria pertusa]
MAQSTIPTLHNLAHSQAFRCLWALEEIKLANPAFQYKLENYARIVGPNPALIKHQRLGKSPIMTLETPDGSPPPTMRIEPGVLTEARLILQFLNSEYGNRMFDPQSEADARRDAFFQEFAVATVTVKVDFTLLFDIIPQFAPFPFNWLLGLLTSPIIKYWLSDLEPIFQLLEDHLSEEKPWFSGEKMGLADMNMTFGMDMAEQRGYFKPEKFPKVSAWMARIRGREAWKRALEKGCGYDLKTFGRYEKADGSGRPKVD